MRFVARPGSLIDKEIKGLWAQQEPPRRLSPLSQGIIRAISRVNQVLLQALRPAWAHPPSVPIAMILIQIMEIGGRAGWDSALLLASTLWTGARRWPGLP